MSFNVGAAVATVKADLTDFKKGMTQAKEELSGLQSYFAEAGKGSTIFAGGLVAAGAAAFGLAAQSTLTAARTETLGIAMKAVAKATGTSTDELDKQEQTLKKQGITTQEARLTLTKFMQSQLDVAEASKLARVAQDLAVIAGENSSVTTGRLTEAIATMNPMLLREVGIVKNSAEVFDAYGATIGKSGQDLTELEKKQALLNLILEEGKKVTGTYEAAMTSAGKKMTSLKRYAEEASNAIGNQFLPAFGMLIDATTLFLKQITNDNVKIFFENFTHYLPVITGAIIGGLIPALRALGVTMWANVIRPLLALSPMIAVGAAIGLGIMWLIDLFGGWEEVVKKAGNALVFLQGKFAPFVAFAENRLVRLQQILASFGISGEFGGLINLFMVMQQKIPFYVERVWQIVSAFVEKIKTKMAGFGVGEKASWLDAFGGIWDRIKPIIEAMSPLFDQIRANLELTAAIFQTQVVPAWNALIEVFKPLLAELGPQLLDMLKGLAVLIGVVLVTAIVAFSGFMAGLMSAIANALPYIMQALEGLIQFIRGFVQLVTGLLSGDLGLVIEGLKQMFMGAGEFIINVFGALLKFISGFIKGVIDFFMGLYEALVGHSIIPDIVNGIKEWFEKLPGFVKNAIAGLADILISPFRDAWNAIQDLMNKIKNAADPNKKHSPSMVDRVRMGVSDLNKAWSKLVMPVPTINHAPQLISQAGGTGAINTIALHIDLNGAIIADDYSAQRISEKIGNAIVGKLQKNIRF